jgi:photosystem II stability/assembly factor-like uncharacterized protein
LLFSSEGGLVALRRWRLTGVALIVFMLAAVSVVALQRIAPRVGAKAPVHHAPAKQVGRVDPDAPAGGSGVEEKVGDPMSGYAGWFYGQRSAPAKRIPVGAMQAAFKQAQTLQANAAVLRGHGKAAVSAGAWVPLGPAPIDGENPAYADPVWSNYGAGIGISTGRLTSLAVDPTDSNTVYIGGADGGIWKTTDGGTTWASISDSLPTQSIGAITIAPDKHNTLYVGTGEPNVNQDSYYGYGVFRSGNGGASFTKVGGSTFDKLTVFRILTRGTGDLVMVATNKGLYRSADRGATWHLVLAPGNPDLFQSFVTDVAFTYTGNEVVAAVGFRTGKSTNGLYVSENAGKTWSNLGSPSGFDAQSDLGRMSLGTTPSQPGLIYAVVQSATLINTPGSATVLKGVYKSTAGPSGPWTEVESADAMAANQSSALTDEHIGGGYRPGIQAWYNQYVRIDPTNPDDVIVGLEEVWNSTDAGANWTVIGRYWDFCISNPTNEPWCNQGATGLHPTTHPDQHAAGFGVDGGNPVLYVGNDGGVWRQPGPGFNNDNWSNKNTNQSTTQCYSAAASADGTIICGLQDNGFVKYTGASLWPEIAGGDGADGVIDPANSQNIIGSYVNMNIYRSNNGGSTYTTISPGDPFPRFISPIAIDPTNPNHIVTVGERIWQTKVGFATTAADWHAMHDLGFPHQSTAVSVYAKHIYDAWCGGCNPSAFNTSAGFASGMVSNIGGWHALAAAGLPNRYVTAVVQDPADKLHIYVTESGFARNWIPSAGFGHVFESTDGGATFTDISGNLPDAPVSSAVLDGSNLIVGTDTGVYEQAGGGTWAPLGTGLPTIVISDLTMVPGSNTLVAASHGRGVFTLDLGA